MKLTSVDSICKSVLLKKGLSLHFFIDTLLSAISCIRELAMDDFKVVNTKILPVTDYSTVEIPDDYIDWTMVAVRDGSELIPLTADERIGSIPYFNSMFAISNSPKSEDAVYSVANRTFKVVNGRNEIQIHQMLKADNIILEYISDGRVSSAATGVHPYAEACIEAFISWQLCENSSSYGMGEKEMMRQRYVSERKILRARMAGWDFNTLRKIINKVY